MNCYYHRNTPGISQCHVCQKVLCRDSCYNDNGEAICRACATNGTEEKNNRRSKAINELLMIAVFFVIARYLQGFLGIEGEKEWLFLWVCTGFPAGWSFLSAEPVKGRRVITTDHFVFELAFKFVFSVIAGAFILPFKVLYNLYLLIKSI